MKENKYNELLNRVTEYINAESFETMQELLDVIEDEYERDSLTYSQRNELQDMLYKSV